MSAPSREDANISRELGDKDSNCNNNNNNNNSNNNNFSNNNNGHGEGEDVDNGGGQVHQQWQRAAHSRTPQKDFSSRTAKGVGSSCSSSGSSAARSVLKSSSGEVKKKEESDKKKGKEAERNAKDAKKTSESAKKGSSSSNSNSSSNAKAVDKNNVGGEEEDNEPIDSDENSNKPAIVIRTLEDLPKDELQIVKKCKIEEAKIIANLDVLASVLSFLRRKEGHTFTTPNLPPHPLRDTTRIFVSPGEYYPADALTPKMLSHYFEEGDPAAYFKIGEQEGIGGFGRVFSARCKNPRNILEKDRVAVKIMPHKTEKIMKMNLNEIGVLKFCDHPNIVRYLRSYLKDDTVWLVLEFLEGGTLTEASANFKFNEPQIAYVAKEILRGLAYLHSKNIVHRDLKSANVMLSMRGDVKIIDFGLCLDISERKEETRMCGSPYWMPPEMIRQQPHSWQADIWSFAVCMLEMIKGEVPNKRSRFRAMFLVGADGITFDREKGKWSYDLNSFLTACLQLDPNKRPTAKELLEHRFLSRAAPLKHMRQIMPAIFLTNTMARQGIL